MQMGVGLPASPSRRFQTFRKGRSSQWLILWNLLTSFLLGGVCVWGGGDCGKSGAGKEGPFYALRDKTPGQCVQVLV